MNKENVLRISQEPVECGASGLEREYMRLNRAYRELVEKEREHRHFFENTRDAIVVFDHELRLLRANPAAVRLLGYPPRSGVKWIGVENIFAQPDMLEDLLRQLLFDGVVDYFETTLCQADPAREKARVIGSGFTHFDGKGRIKHLEFLFTDITERQKMERRLQQSQKIEAVGVLAGGVAHDFNNLLMGIQGHVSLMSLDLSPTHPHRMHLAAMEAYVESGSNLTKQLLGFARGGKYEAMPVDIHELIVKSASMFGRTRKEIQIRTRLLERPLVVEADRGQIEQVLMNLHVNALQAMPGGGDLRLETTISELDEIFCRPYRVQPGRYARISIIDTGVGMDDAVLPRIFDPFFTTRGARRGTGLGLASAHGIIKNHGGMITVYSEVNRGSVFHIYLPLSGKPGVHQAPSSKHIQYGSETVLLVDDEPLIIEVGKPMLEKIGYRVLVAEGGEKALAIAEAMGREIDLVILDLIMPGMDGAKTFDLLRKLRPDMPVLLSSGYALDSQAGAVMNKGCNGFIQKPYNLSTLSNKIRRALGEGCEAPGPEKQLQRLDISTTC